jgi:hypothetical protein
MEIWKTPKEFTTFPQVLCLWKYGKLQKEFPTFPQAATAAND